MDSMNRRQIFAAAVVFALGCGGTPSDKTVHGPLANATEPEASTPSDPGTETDQDGPTTQTWINRLSTYNSKEELEEAVTALSEVGDPVAIAPLVRLWKANKTDNRAPGVVRALTRIANQKSFRGRPGPFWEGTISVFEEAVAAAPMGREEIDDAILAADALGRARSSASIPVLASVALAENPQLSPRNMITIAAVRTLGTFGESRVAIDALIKVLERDVHKQSPKLHAAAADSLGNAKSPEVVKPLISAMIRVPPIYFQVRRALVRIGPITAIEMKKVFRGSHAEVNKVAKANQLNSNCRAKGASETTCRGPGRLRFLSASLLGDVFAKDAAAMLAKRLSKPARPSYYTKSGTEGPSDHLAILGALEKINEPAVADKVFRYATNKRMREFMRARALDVFYTIAARGAKLKALRKITRRELAGSPSSKQEIGMAAARAVSRLTTERADLKFLESVRVKGGNGTLDVGPLQTAARVGIECGARLECYTSVLGLDAEGVADRFSLGSVPDEEMPSHFEAAIDRALLEVTKAGPAAAAALPKVLALASSSGYYVLRLRALRAVVHIGGVTCVACRGQLTKALDEQSDNKKLVTVIAETRIIRDYLAAFAPR